MGVPANGEWSNRKAWTEYEEKLLREHYATKGAGWCAERLPSRSARRVAQKAQRMRQKDAAMCLKPTPWSVGPVIEKLYLLGLEVTVIAEKLGVPYNRVHGYLNYYNLRDYRRWHRETQANEILKRHGLKTEEKAA